MSEKKIEPNVQTIENATRDDVRPGDHVVWEWAYEQNGVTVAGSRKGTAHHRDRDDDWRTKGDEHITNGQVSNATITIRRPVQELPTGLGAVIVAKEGGGCIEAAVLGVVWRAREAVFGGDGRWHGVWRSTSGAISYAAPDQITPGTWKVEGE